MPLNTKPKHVAASFACGVLSYPILTFLLLAQLAQAGPTSSHVVDQATYERILDRIFPNPEAPSDKYQYRIVLRFLPSNQSEMQLIIRMTNAGNSEATISQVAGRSVWNTANDYINQDQRKDEGEIARAIQVKTRNVPIPAELAEKWYSRLLKSISESSGQLEKDTDQFRLTHEIPIVLEGTTYQLSMDQGVTNLHWEAIDEEISPSQITGRFASARAMNEVFQSAETLATKHP
jgi:hypothetical protein